MDDVNSKAAGIAAEIHDVVAIIQERDGIEKKFSCRILGRSDPKLFLKFPLKKTRVKKTISLEEAEEQYLPILRSVANG